MSYGAAIHQLWMPDRAGRRANIVLGFSTLDEYVAHDGHYFGATIGRYANRIGRGRFRLDGVAFELPLNDGGSSLHGGPGGFDRRVWEIEEASTGTDEARVELGYTSAGGEMGYPGKLTVQVAYTLAGDCTLRIDYRASTDEPTVVNLTNHALWNLAGEGARTVVDHLLTLGAGRYTPVDEELLPTGEIAPVTGTPLDFTSPARIGARIGENFDQLILAGGYDHNFVLDRTDSHSLAFGARLRDPQSGRTLELHTTEPGLQLYSGNRLDGSLIGPGGQAYFRHGGVALETQHFPDSPNRSHFPSTALRPGDVFASTTLYRFL